MTICPYCANELHDGEVRYQTIAPRPPPLSSEDLEMARAFHDSDPRTRTIVGLALGVPLPDRRRHPPVAWDGHLERRSGQDQRAHARG
jgi:hypothetical protein